MTAQQLRNSILQMAVQGKLVSQDPNDEPASKLLERIRKEKESLIKAGKIKKEKNPSIIFRGADNLPYERCGGEVRCIADEVPFEIPESWEWVRVCYCTELYNGRAFKPSDWTSSGIPIVRIQNLNNPNAFYNLYSGPVDSVHILNGGELLFSWSGTPGTSFGAHIWHGGQAVLNQHIFRLEFNKELLDCKYYMFALNQRVTELILLAHGSAGLQHVTKEVFENTLIPLPAFSEQKRIVTEIEKLLPYIESYGHAEMAREKLYADFPEQLRKSILQQALQGKLIPQDPADEPASILLERIHTEKQRLIKAGTLKKGKHESTIFRRDNSHYEKLDGIERCIDEEIPFEIPENWAWARFQTVITIASNLVKPQDYQDYVHIAPDNIVKGRGTLMKYSTVKDDKVKSPNHLFSSGQILYSKIRPALRKAVIAPCDGLCSADMYPLDTHLNSFYVLYLILSDYFTLQVTKEDTRVKMPKANQEALNKILIPVPPLAEQQHIAAKIERLLLLLDVAK